MQMNNKCKCKSCGCAVVDGENGTVYEPAPWMDEGTPSEALCYRCENRFELEAELRREDYLIEAAQRAGRFDLI